jgi:hypothetical protein
MRSRHYSYCGCEWQLFRILTIPDSCKIGWPAGAPASPTGSIADRMRFHRALTLRSAGGIDIARIRGIFMGRAPHRLVASANGQEGLTI